MLLPLPIAMMMADVPAEQGMAGQDASQPPSAPAQPAPAPGSNVAADAVGGAAQAGSPPADTAADQSSPLVGDVIVVTGRPHSPVDPLEAINVKSFETVESLDKAVVAPVAKTYENDVPKPVRSGLRNFLNNLDEPVVAVNFLLQHRIGKAFETVGRFAINSTIGVAGLMDVAKRKPFNLPHRNNGFADTMGFYGVKQGAYMFLPLIGSTTVRDLTGFLLDHAMVPLAVGSPFNKAAYNIPTGVIHSLDTRLEFNDELMRIRQSSDPYLAMRKYYLRMRAAEIAGLHSHKTKKPPKAETAAPQGS